MFFRRDATRVSLAYRYHNPRWDLPRNRAVYGVDHSEEGIGANMTIWLEVEGSLNEVTDLLIPEKSSDPVLARLKKGLDHRCLFEVEPWFEKRVPTLENIALFLTEKIDTPWASLTVEENENWRVQLFSGKKDVQLSYSTMIGFTRTEATFAGPIDSESGLMMNRSDFQNRLKDVNWQHPEKCPGLIGLRRQEPRQNAIEWRLRNPTF